MIEKTGRVLPLSREQLFDLVADIERYPEFLPGWIAARILRREGNVCDVEQVLGVGPMRVAFTSRAVMMRPERIDISSEDAHFRHYSQTVQVVPQSAGGCSLQLRAQLQLSSRMLDQIASRMLPASLEDSIRAFEERALRLYGATPGGAARSV